MHSPLGVGALFSLRWRVPDCACVLQVLEKACELCEKAGAKQAKMLNVSGAFHTPYARRGRN